MTPASIGNKTVYQWNRIGIRLAKVNFIIGFTFCVFFLSPHIVHAAPGGLNKHSDSTKSSNSNRMQGKESRRGLKDLNEINRLWMKELHRDASSNAKIRNKPNVDERKPASPLVADKKDSPGGIEKGFSLRNPGRAQDRNTNNAIFARSEAPSLVDLVLRFAGFLALMLGLFYLLVRYLKSKSGALSPGNDLIRVIASLPLVQGKFIQIVDMAGKLMVLGVSDSGVALISEIEDARTADRIRLWQSERGDADRIPRDLLSRITAAVRTADYKFWSSEKSDAGRTRTVNPSFGEQLKRQGGVVARPKTKTSEARDTSEVRDESDLVGFRDLDLNFGEDLGLDPEQKHEREEEIRLKELLESQRRRLASLRRSSYGRDALPE